MSHPALRCAAAALLFAACTRTPDAAPDAGRPAAASDDDDVKPVYAATPGVPDALAARLCQILQRLPEERRAACCGSAPFFAIATECDRVLSSALRSKAISIDAAALERCGAAMDRGHRGCEWVGPGSQQVPSDCRRLLQGARGVGKACRSSLECAANLRCSGLGPTQAGVCAPARRNGEPCNTAVDPLAVYARQEIEDVHPECAGSCSHFRCVARGAAGAVCNLSGQCEGGLHCAAGKCAAGAWAAVGDPCTGGGCAAEARCIAGVCALPKPTGASCSKDEECLGGCVSGDGGRRCAIACTPLPR